MYRSAADVYKRQGQSGAGYLDEKEFSSHVYYEYASIDVGKFYDNLTKGVDTVSYTHLDVYKRQIICRFWKNSKKQAEKNFENKSSCHAFSAY